MGSAPAELHAVEDAYSRIAEEAAAVGRLCWTLDNRNRAYVSADMPPHSRRVWRGPPPSSLNTPRGRPRPSHLPRALRIRI
jgi:hypothetical protein